MTCTPPDYDDVDGFSQQTMAAPSTPTSNGDDYNRLHVRAVGVPVLPSRHYDHVNATGDGSVSYSDLWMGRRARQEEREIAAGDYSQMWTA